MEDIASIGATAIGLFCIYKSKQRRFRRTNQFGIEVFSSYFKKLKSRFIDETFFASGVLLLCYGSISLCIKYAGDMLWILILVLAALVIENIILNDRRKLNHVKQMK